MSNPKLDMEHGFVHNIVKNQKDRDAYDKEVKAAKENQPPQMARLKRQRPKKPDMKTYKAPTSSRDPSEWNKPKELIFRLEYEDSAGKMHFLPIHREDDVTIISKRFGMARDLTPPMIKALIDLINEKKEELFLEEAQNGSSS